MRHNLARARAPVETTKKPASMVALGAVRVRLLYDGNDSCIVMQDIEGNEFDID